MRRVITTKDELIWRLLQDPNWRVSKRGKVFTRIHGGSHVGNWRRAGWRSPSRNGEKLYWRLQYKGVDLYEHRIVWAAFKGHLSPFKTINHKDLNGLNNSPLNLELTTPQQNIQHARAFYRRTGMSAREARAHWITARGQHGDWNNRN